MFKRREPYGYLRMDVILIVDYLKEMQNIPLLQQLQLLKRVILLK